MNHVPATAPPSATRPARHPGRLRRAGLSLALLALLGLPLAACDGSGSSSAAPTAGSSSGSSQSGQAAFAQCMRSHGVQNFSDPQSGHFILGKGVQDNPNFQSAMQACQHLLGAGGVGGSSNNSAMLNYAHCMQTHGVPQFPDPPSSGALDIPSSVDQSSPQFQKAQQECKSDLPGSQGQQS
jgi:hypothetical protein